MNAYLPMWRLWDEEQNTNAPVVSCSAGWINFNPTHGEVTVYADHLEGYAWGENIGWIRLGTHTGGGAHTYTNDAAGTYGVNNDGSGSLSGYAWGTNVGRINSFRNYKTHLPLVVRQ